MPETQQEKPKCTCYPTPPWTWTTHFGHVEPGSTLEPNPQCPEHSPEYAEHEREIEQLLANIRDSNHVTPLSRKLATEVERLRAERPDWTQVEKAHREKIAQEIEHMESEAGELPAWRRCRSMAAHVARNGLNS